MLAVDLDGLDQGPVDDPAVAPEEGVEHALWRLSDCPSAAALGEASCWWSYTSSQGLQPGKLFVRLWFLLARPLTDEEARRWAHAVNAEAGFKLVDPALYNPVQPHYVADPILDGIDDPLPRRSGFRRGLVDEPLLVPPRPAPRLVGQVNGIVASCSFEAALGEIGGARGFNATIWLAARTYLWQHGLEGTDWDALRARLQEAILQAPPGHRGRREIERYASARYLDDEFKRLRGAMPRSMLGRRRPAPSPTTRRTRRRQSGSRSPSEQAWSRAPWRLSPGPRGAERHRTGPSRRMPGPARPRCSSTS